MKIRNIAITLLCATALFIVTCPGLVTAAQLLGRPVKPDPEAVAAGNRWFAVFDSGDYKTAWHMMAKRVQRGGAVHEEQFIAVARVRRTPLGRVPSPGTDVGAIFKHVAGGSCLPRHPAVAYLFLVRCYDHT